MGYENDIVVRKAESVTPNDSADLNNPGTLWVGGGGTVVVDMMDGGTGVSFVGVPAGTHLKAFVKRVRNTGTTASSILVHPR